SQADPLPLVGVDPFSAKSGLVGSALPNIGVTQDFSAMGIPLTFGMGLMSNAGAGVDFRFVPESHGTSMDYLALDIVMAAGYSVTDNLSVGAAFTLGSSYLDGPFVDISGMTPAYALRGTVGASYALNDDTTLGLYWQSKKHFTFDDAAVFQNGATYDVEMDHPMNFGFGIANHSLMDGKLLLAADVLYNCYGDADFFKSIYTDQWVLSVGAQYEVNRQTRLRLGYAWAEDPMRNASVTSIGGVPLPDGVPALRYIQGQFAAINQHRITGGIGKRDVLPGVDFDFFAGGMFGASQRFASTTASVASYWVGAGITWRFGRGACERLPVADEWGCTCDE
ncbi:MAG: outer membrane protein transport protein, partial [Planctomycetia bacterium]|nr:outer membrane protein transport protein [Planctomycetia bacterium]